MRIVRRTEFVEMPWKNGAGITHEAIRVPAQGSEFAWRVSLAEIGESGPFSDFAGYTRWMTLLSGRGLDLEFADGRRCRLGNIGACVEFAGAPAPQCRLLEGRCVDLNLMVAARYPVTARVEHVRGMLDIPAARESWTLIFGIDGSIDVEGGNNGPERLNPWDLAILSSAEGPEVRASASALVFIAVISQ